MFKKIIKRDGRVVDFNAYKITNAIAKAGKATGEFSHSEALKLTYRVLNIASQVIKNRTPAVEEIQDIVEEVLLSSPYKKTAKAYILYRDQHRIIREISSKFNINLIDSYLTKSDWKVKENSNMSFSLQGLNNYISQEVTKTYWLNKLYSQEIKKAHQDGSLHIHDLGILAVYCVGWDLLDLLQEGFRGAEGKIESKPAKHFCSILGQIVNFFYTLQGEASGAQAFSNFDTLLSPFIYYDGLSYKEIKQTLQEFIFNMNIPTRTGFQSPFTNITLDLTCPPHLTNQPVIIGGKPQNKTYKEFKKEQDMFNKALLEVMLEGDAKGRVFTFPVITINITKDFDWANENLNILWEVTARYGIPYFANFINSDMKPEDARSMCLHPDEELVIRKKGKIAKTTIGKLVESEAKEFDSDGWSDTKSVIEILSLNPENYQIEWVKIKRFLKVKDDILITVRTVDGKEMKISQNHLVAVYTPNGIKTKLAKNLEKDDILLTTRKAQNIFKQNYQMIGTKKLDEKLGYLVGFFVADGNYLYDSRYEQKKTRGIQFNFNTTDQQQQLIIKKLVQDIYDYELKFIQDPRYKHSLRGYLYRTDIAKEWITTGIEKYNNIPEIILNSPLSVIQAFLEGFFRGDGYQKGKEIHINDEGLARDLVILMTLAGVNCTYRKRKNSQVIRIQHTLGRGAKYTNIVVDTLYNRVPQFLVKTSHDKPFYNKNVMPCKSSLDRREAHTEESIKILNSEIALVKVESIKIEYLSYKQDFYDIELEKNHYFVHSLGNITHNCCRLRIDNRKLEKRGGGLFGASPQTGSIGVVTINMPRIGYLSKTEKDFFERLKYLMELAKDSLEIKRKILERLTENNLYPYSKFYLRNIKKRFNQYWKNHFSTIGLVGMNEACINFLNKDIGSKEGRDFALRVLDFMRDKLLEFQKETNNNYNLEATPAEGATFRLAKIDKEKFPQIICANEEEFRKGGSPFYTNSTHLPVNYTDDIFEVLKHQDLLQTKYTGGCIEKGNKVLTDKGLIKIEDIFENFGKLKPIKALSFNKEKKIAEWDEIVEAVKINVKKHNKIRIIGERNLDIITSDWHPFFVLEKFKPNSICPVCGEKIKNIKAFATHIKWNPECKRKYKTFPKYRVIEKRADELKVGDYILQNFYNMYPQKTTELNDDLMWLIGFFIGDGSISEFVDNRGGNNLKRYKVRFHSKNQEGLEKAKEIMSKYFGVKAKVIKNDKRSKPLREFTTSKRNVWEFFFKYEFKSGKKVYKVSIPQKVKENINNTNVFALLSGLIDSDGNINKRGGNVEYFTVSSKLAEDILEICSSAGIAISKSKKLTKRGNEINGWRLTIPAYEATQIKKKLAITSSNLLKIKDNLSNRKKRYLPVVRVKKISKVNVKDNQFYDLTTKKNHNYLAGKDCLVFIHNTVLHIYIGEKIENPQIIKKLVRKICQNYRLPYLTITPTFSICPQHGYISGEYRACPNCNAPCEIYSRVVGYLRPVSFWNDGKREEFKLRKTFKVEI